jgi:hypothetical protein
VRNEGVNEIGGLAGPSANWSLISLDLDSVFLLPDLPHTQQQGFYLTAPTPNLLPNLLHWRAEKKHPAQ